jgi:hypothetical protein
MAGPVPVIAFGIFPRGQGNASKILESPPVRSRSFAFRFALWPLVYIHMKGGKLFAFAGLWERWAPPDGEAIKSCTILTTDANELTKPIHDRMPVIVDPGDYKQWLDPAERPHVLQELLRSYSPKPREAYSVST